MKYLKEFLSLMFLPISIIDIFIVKPLARFVLKKELNILKEEKISFSEIYKEKLKESSENHLQIELFKKQLNRFNSVYNDAKDNICEIALTKYNEMVLISYVRDAEKHFDKYKLYGFNSSEGILKPDSFIYLEISYDNGILKIQDFGANLKQKGYGRTLLNFVIQRAKENKNIRLIVGDLSSTDEFEFKWLLPFYKSLGFEIVLFEDKSKQMLGKIKLDLTK